MDGHLILFASTNIRIYVKLHLWRLIGWSGIGSRGHYYDDCAQVMYLCRAIKVIFEHKMTLSLTWYH